MKIIIADENKIVGVIEKDCVTELNTIPIEKYRKEMYCSNVLREYIEKQLNNLEGKIIELGGVEVVYNKKTHGCEGCDIKEHTSDWNIVSNFCLGKCNLEYVFKITN